MDVLTMTTEELERELPEVVRKLASIRTALDTAKSNAIVDKQYSDKDWFNRTKFALRMTGIEHQAITRELGKRSKEDRQRRNDSMERRFMQVAKRRLNHELFMDMVAEAEES